MLGTCMRPTGSVGSISHAHHYFLLPDIVIHSPARNVVFAIQAATRGDGPINEERYRELEEISSLESACRLRERILHVKDFVGAVAETDRPPRPPGSPRRPMSSLH